MKRAYPSNFSDYPHFRQMQTYPDTSNIVAGFNLNTINNHFPIPNYGGGGYSMPEIAPTPAPINPPKIADNSSIEFDLDVPMNIELLKGKRVKVTMGELYRRVSFPELSNFSNLSRLMRIAKSNSSTFSKKLKACGLNLAQNESISKGAMFTTVFSGMLEAESIELGRDFGHFMINELPTNTISAYIFQFCGYSRDHIVTNTEGMRCILLRVKDHLLCAGREPADATRPQIEWSAQSVQKFSLITHGFGPIAAVAVIDGLIKLVSSLKKIPAQEEIQILLQPIVIPSFNSFADTSIMSNCSSNDSGFFQSSPSTSSGPPSTSSSPNTVSPTIFSPYNDSFDAVWLATPRDDDNVAFEPRVLPRLSHDDTFEMTRGELRRRIFGPEHLNSSLICSYIRKGKGKNTLKDLREKLEANQIAIKNGTKKGISPRTWTSIAEREAIQLARETANELRSVRPSQAVYDVLAQNPNARDCLRIVLQLTRNAFGQIGQDPANVNLQTAADIQLYRFALITHHFGHSFMVSVCDWLSHLFSQPQQNAFGI